MRLLLLLVAVGVACAFQAPLSLTRKRYDGYKVFKIFPTNRHTIDVLHDLMLNDENVDFWQEPSQLYKEIEFMVPPEYLSVYESKLRRENIDYGFKIDDVQEELLTPMWNDIQKRDLLPDQQAFNIDDYNTLDDINSWLATLAGQCRSGLTCQVYNAGNSYSGKPINIFKISKAGSGRKAYWLDATIHAREWIATATLLKIINNLATGGDANAVRLTDSYDWYLMPVMNPDGYDYTWTNDRLWRKNRRPNTGSTCYGTDLNRNFDFRWGKEGVSNLPCGETYCGPSGNSEPETKVVAAELNRLASTLAATVTIHSYGNMWMFPWGNTIDYAGKTCQRADDHADLMRVSDATANAIQATYNTRWSRGNSCEVIYATTGGTDDYAKGVSGVKYAFCPELRGNSFVIPASNIPLSFNEVWNGVVAMCDSIGA